MNKKAELLEAIASQNRGLLTTETEKVKILTLVEQLEDQNPTRKPLEAPDLLNGNWRLLYTTSKGILGLDRVPLLKLGQIYQCIRVESTKVYNIAEILGLPFLEGIVSVAAEYYPVSEKRVNVKFTRSIIASQRLIDYRSCDRFIEDIENGKKFFAIDFNIENRDTLGWLEVTYLDSDLRLGRGNEGNIFVLAKEKLI